MEYDVVDSGKIEITTQPPTLDDLIQRTDAVFSRYWLRYMYTKFKTVDK
jgi:hypothetical protein